MECGWGECGSNLNTCHDANDQPASMYSLRTLAGDKEDDSGARQLESDETSATGDEMERRRGSAGCRGV